MFDRAALIAFDTEPRGSAAALLRLHRAGWEVARYVSHVPAEGQLLACALEIHCECLVEDIRRAGRLAASFAAPEDICHLLRVLCAMPLGPEPRETA